MDTETDKMNFDELCRICGEKFKDPCETVDEHKEEILKYLPVQADEESSEFPKNVCSECLSLVRKWDEFYKRCSNAQKKFATLLEEKRTKSTLMENEASKEEITEEKTTGADESKEKTAFPCNFCQVQLENQQQLNDHLVALHCDVVFCCDICKNFKPRDDLIAHMTEHALSCLQSSAEDSSTTTDKLQCSECDKQFISASGLKYHMNSSHAATKQFACDQCNASFSCKRVLLNHQRSIHNKDDKEFKCPDCNKSFKTDSTLFAHRKTHSTDAAHKCFTCGKGFKFKHHLDSHQLQHKSKEKTFECQWCNKKFAALNNLTKHKKIHDKSTEFVCEICGVKMLQKRYLTDHMKKVHPTHSESIETAD